MSVSNSSNRNADMAMVNNVRGTPQTPQEAYQELIAAAQAGRRVTAQTVQRALQNFPEEVKAWQAVCADGAIRKKAESEPGFMALVLSANYKDPAVKERLLSMTLEDFKSGGHAYKKLLAECNDSDGMIGQTMALARNPSFFGALNFMLRLNAGSSGLLGKTPFNGALRMVSEWFDPDKILGLFGAPTEGYTPDQMKLIRKLENEGAGSLNTRIAENSSNNPVLTDQNGKDQSAANLAAANAGHAMA